MLALWMYFKYFLRRIIKWFLHKTTGLCELQRLCYGAVSGAPRTSGVEKSLRLSRSVRIQQILDYLDTISAEQKFTPANEREILRDSISTVINVKRINPRIHPQFVTSFGRCIEQIWGYKQLVIEVEGIRKTSYDSYNIEHERKLQELWFRLMPDQPLESRITKQWQDIGFQGDDPKTDFRGMGMLGLENLLFFVTEYKGAAAHVLAHSHHPVYGYAFAIVGINLTSMAWQLLQSGDAKFHFYNTTKSLPSMRHFHQFYCYLFYEFDKYWLDCKPKNIMDFSVIRERFENNIRLGLKDTSVIFRNNFSIENI